jgi:uncharacterized membrane protein
VADRFATRLAAEAWHWVRDGLLSAQQAERILAEYATEPSWYSRPIGLLSVIGGAFIAAGIALVVSHNWEAIHRWVKLGGLVGLLGAAQLSGLAVRERGYPRAGEGMLVIGGSLLLVGIALVGQIYNLSGRPSDAVLLWWVLLLPLAYTLPSMALGALGYLGASVWFGMALMDPGTVLGREAWRATAFAGLAVTLTGAIGFGLGVLHGDGEYRRLRQLLEQLGLLALFGGLLPFGLSWRLGFWGERAPAGFSPVLALLLVAALLAILAAAIRLPADSRQARLGFLSVPLVFLAYVCAVKLAFGFGPREETLRALTYVNWVVILGGALALVLYGARWDRTSWINWGVALLGIHALARYLDLVGTMLETSMLFFSAGLFVLLLGWGLERMRRRITAGAAARKGS